MFATKVVRGLSKEDLYFLMRESKSPKEREDAGKCLLAQISYMEDLHRTFLSFPEVRGHAISRFFEIADSPELVQGKLKIWHLEDARRIAQILQ